MERQDVSIVLSMHVFTDSVIFVVCEEFLVKGKTFQKRSYNLRDSFTYMSVIESASVAVVNVKLKGIF